MPGRVIRFENYEVDFERRELRKAGVRIGLQQKPFRVLELLLRHPGKLVTRDELIAYLWPDSHVSFERGLNTAVNSLRHALGESCREALFIETRPGFGYRFQAPVQEIAAEDVPLRSSTPLDRGHIDQDCLKGRYFLDRLTSDETCKALAYFRAALSNGACLGLAQAGIAEASCQLVSLGCARSADLECQARRAAANALLHDPHLPQAHVVNGRVKMIFGWDWKGAQDAVSCALALDPASVSAHILQASLLTLAGRHNEAVRISRKTLELNSLSFPANLHLAKSLYAARQYQATVNACWNLLTLTSPFAPAHLLLALAYEQLGLTEESLVEFENARSGSAAQSAALSGQGHILARIGFRKESEEVFRQCFTHAVSAGACAYGRALQFLSNGSTEEALQCLQDCFEARDDSALHVAADPRFDSLRADERFLHLLSQLSSTRSGPMPCSSQLTQCL